MPTSLPHARFDDFPIAPGKNLSNARLGVCVASTTKKTLVARPSSHERTIFEHVQPEGLAERSLRCA